MRTLLAALLLLTCVPASAAPAAPAACIHTAGEHYTTTVCQADVGDGGTDWCPETTSGAPLPPTDTSVCVDYP